ncbi:MAG: addiction module antitoxin [Gammaproteobacteria bacterium]|nr:addiction module antitoxin [Gammaproteobacteria bacterium]
MQKNSNPDIPGSLTIKARQIQEWAETSKDARDLLPVLLRKLVHSTGRDLRRVDFPGYDNAERHGWDGLVDTDDATPWIPEGKSCWEFGTGKDPRNKADHDYAARLDSVSPDERAECTFVFVTTRNWSGKTAWEKRKHSEGDWKAVRAFDASDIEQWLEESLPVQVWLAEQLGMPVDGFKTLEQHKREWEDASEPPMTPVLFEPSVTVHREPSVTANRQTFKDWLEKPSERPFVVAADSKNEALAFLAYLFNDAEMQLGDCAVVFESARTLRMLTASQASFIPVACTKATERELASVYRRFHCIIVRPRNAIDSKPDIELDLLDHNTFEKALADMGIEGERVEHLARESGYSPTILRRRLSKIEAIRKPRWSSDAQIARSLIPMALVGAWCAESEADCEIISTLDDNPYHQIEVNVANLLQFDDSPVWSVGQNCGVVSKMDALFAINKQVTKKNLSDFFLIAEYVLSESDPALEMPEDDRWMAGVYGKVRDHSAALRKGICETLVIFSVHGNDLFRHRLGVDVESHVSQLIKKLLTPLSLEKLLSHNDDLPLYAEAAPDEFLNLIEEDLRQPQPVVLGLLKPADRGLFDSPSRAGLLWALECLAWKHLGRVSLILARLSETVIDDNWSNKPINSLESIYRSWLPQTAAPLADRIKALEKLTRQFPDIGWQICMAQLYVGDRTGEYSYRPLWRNDASGAGGSVTQAEYHQFMNKVISLVIAWPKHDQNTLGELIERLPRLPEKYQTSVWNLIDAWADSETDENAKAGLRERIRSFAFTRLSRRFRLQDTTKTRARISYEKLQPRDIAVRHAWLFDQDLVEDPNDDSDDGKFDFEKSSKTTFDLRAAAMQEIWGERGLEGVTALLSLTEIPGVAGESLVECITDINAQADFLRQCLSITGDLERKIGFCMHGFLNSLGDKARGTLLSMIADSMVADQIVRLLCCAPFKHDTWRLLDQYGEEVRNRYWQEIPPSPHGHSETEISEVVERLLEAKRPRAAFYSVGLNWPQIETSQMKRLFHAVATVDAEPDGQYRIESYYISEALKSLNGRSGVSPDKMAQFEFIFLDALEHSEHGIPNLERHVAKSPTTFVQLLALAFKRNDDGQDPPEWGINDPKHRENRALKAYRILDRIECIPGTDKDGKVDFQTLLAWVTEARKLCAKHGRATIGDQYIGQILSKSLAEEDGSWPCFPVCEAMERVDSQEIRDGFVIGVYNGRGVVTRGEGGYQERELAERYRGWAKLREDYPFVRSTLEIIATDYDHEAEGWDDESKTRKRLRH